MYTDNKSVQIVISLLKEYNVRLAVLSPGVRNVPIVHSLENDPFFTCHSVVDERSAGYFALGLALETGESVILSCTSGTAAANYTSAIWEATRQNLPLIALTSDRNQYSLNQLEDQMITQDGLYRSACKISVTLPIIDTLKDYWYCERLVNEALLGLNHRGGGPVHINIPTEWGLFAENFHVKTLPKCRRIKRYSLKQAADIEQKIAELKGKRILIIYGQSRPASKKLLHHIEGFVTKFNCAIAVESISNLWCNGTINTNLIARSNDKSTIKKYIPDIVISMQGNYVSTLKGLLKGEAMFDHWTVNEEGNIVDQFQQLTSIFECSAEDFFTYFDTFGGAPLDSHDYLEFWQQRIDLLPKPNFQYSSAYAMQEFIKRVPSGARLHHGNGVAVHIAQYFTEKPGVLTYCHTGTTTIDGSLSAFIGQAAATKEICFAFIGDLSFFYDMNAIWNRHVGNNVRILLYNNEGGQTFHWNAAKDIPTLPLHTSAEHFTSARGWVESIGFSYYAATTQKEFDAMLPEFMSLEHDKPVLFEVFTKKEIDAKILLDFYAECKQTLQNTPMEKKQS